MLRVGQFDCGIETGGWRKTHKVMERGDWVTRFRISSSAFKHPSLTVAEGTKEEGSGVERSLTVREKEIEFKSVRERRRRSRGS